MMVRQRDGEKLICAYMPWLISALLAPIRGPLGRPASELARF
jgi:hypothetical protein